MTLAIVASAENTHFPPRIRIDVTESEPTNTITSLSIFRDGIPLRFDPVITGAGSALVYDYDAQFDVEYTYRADGTELGLAVDWAEPWADLDDWSSPPGVPAEGFEVAGGVATSNVDNAIIYRDSSDVLVRVEVVNPSNVRVEIADSSSTVLGSVITSPDGTVTVIGQGASSSTTGSGSYTINLTDVSMAVVGTGWALTVPFAAAPFYGDPTRVQLVAPSSMLLGSFDVTATSWDISSFAVDSDGAVYFVSASDSELRKYSSTGVLLDSWSLPAAPRWVAIDGSDDVYVGDDDGDITKYNDTGTVITSWSGAGRGAAFDSSDNVYVANGAANTVSKYSSTGTPITSWATPERAMTIAVDGSNVVYVGMYDIDGENKQVGQYSNTGTELDVWTDVPSSVVIGANGSSWFTAEVAVDDATVRQYDDNGDVTATWEVTGTEFAVRGFDVYSARSGYGTSGTHTVYRWDASPGSVEDVTAYIVETSFSVSDSDTETLSPTGAAAGAWLTNANQPALAILAEHEPVSSDDDYFIVTSTRESSGLQANSVALPIEGSAEVVTAVLGPRRKEQWTLDVACTTQAAYQALIAMLADSAAISLRLPSSQRWIGLDGGFYAVGDVETERRGHPQLGPIVVVSMPLTTSRAPVYKSLWQWNARTLAQTGMTSRDVMNAYATARDLLIGPL